MAGFEMQVPKGNGGAILALLWDKKKPPHAGSCIQRDQAWFASSLKSRLQYLGPKHGVPCFSEEPPSQQFSLDPSADVGTNLDKLFSHVEPYFILLLTSLALDLVPDCCDVDGHEIGRPVGIRKLDCKDNGPSCGGGGSDGGGVVLGVLAARDGSDGGGGVLDVLAERERGRSRK
ncbi:hypothetical protein RJ641_019420 [Dillenia turbinata]|uniref:Uncharacterized protein n=1 Tax=Dillenia turbinata TaxID=194707 RepID=A0AAN8YVE6_9MAGN